MSDVRIKELDNSQLTLKKVQAMALDAKNNSNKKYMLVLKNTKGLSSDVFNEFCNTNNVQIRVKGGMDEEKNSKYDKHKYIERTIYSPKELCSIVGQYEKIEAKINPQWSDLAKSLFVYRTLAKNIKYDYDNMNNGGQVGIDIRNLRGMNTRSTVCAGYAMIYKEAMDRIGIPCRYINNPGAHGWNSIEADVDGKKTSFNVDMTWDRSGYNKCGAMGLSNFGENAKDFYAKESHQVDASEYPLPSGMLTRQQLKKALYEIDNNQITKIQDKHFSLIAMGGDNFIYAACQKKINGELSSPKILVSANNIASLDFATDDKNTQKFIDGLLLKGEHGGVQYFKDGKENYGDIELKTFKRDDGSSFALISNKNKKYPEANQYNYVEFKSVNGNLELKKSVIYSEQDLLHPKSSTEQHDVANKLLSSGRIDEKISSAGGYVGYMNAGHKTNNKMTEKKIANCGR